MCGICGIVDFTGSVPDGRVVQRMTDLLRPRGPDGEGVHCAPYFGFGHSRLSIIDLSETGAQPMSDADGSVWITFNGEIYNYREMKTELMGAGTSFRGNSDTEVLIHGYKTWGMEKLLSKCRGMWAFALWDDQAKKLVLCRDRFGKKPLFYCRQGSRLVFASTLNSLRCGADLQALDNEALSAYLGLSYMPPSRCAFAGVDKVPAASWMEFSDGKAGVIRSYWSLRYDETSSMTVTDAAERCEELIGLSIDDRLVADVHIGAFLSGGLDSGLLVKKAAEKYPTLSSFTMTLSNSWRDESARAHIVADHAHTDHHEIAMDPSCVADLPFIVEQYGEPFADSSMIPAAAVSREAARHLKVILSGDGGDEVFGGYGRPARVRTLLERKRRLPVLINMLLGIAGGCWINRPAWPLFGHFRYLAWDALVMGKSMEGFVRGYSILDHTLARHTLGKNLSCLSGEAYRSTLGYLDSDLAAASPWKAMLKFGFDLILEGDFLVKMDVATMMHGLEARCPLLDHRLAEFAMSLPWETWQVNGETKGLLRKVIARNLPQEFLNYPKHGFSIPVEEYLLGQWREPFLRLIKNGHAEEMGLVNGRGVERFVEKCIRMGRRSHPYMRYLFSLFCLEIWLRVCYARTQTAEEISAMLREALKKQ